MNQNYQEKNYQERTLTLFQNIVAKTLLFHLCFASFGVFFCLLFFFLYSTLAESYLIAICIACLFFIAVSYFVLRLYFQEQNPRKFYELSENFRLVCKERGIEASTSLEEMASKLSSLDPLLPFGMRLPNAWLRKILYLPDLYLMKEIFLLASIVEHLDMIKKSPTSFNTHANLAKAYGSLADLYKNSDFDDEKRQEKLHQSIMRAIEELKILKEYAPDSLWARKQLASHFHALKLPENEIEEYEAICALCPQDSSAFVTLGTIYFQQGKTAKGLKIYEALKEKDKIAALELLNFYGSSPLLMKKL